MKNLTDLVCNNEGDSIKPSHRSDQNKDEESSTYVPSRREFLKGAGIAVLATSLGSYEDSISKDKDYSRKTVTSLEELGERLSSQEPSEVLYDLGEGDKRSELIISYFKSDADGNPTSTVRSSTIDSSPLMRLCKENGEIVLHINDPDSSEESYEISPRKVVYEPPKILGYTKDQRKIYDGLGSLEIEDGNHKLVIAQYYRSEN